VGRNVFKKKKKKPKTQKGCQKVGGRKKIYLKKKAHLS